jgi:lambda family phage portal protein
MVARRAVILDSRGTPYRASSPPAVAPPGPVRAYYDSSQWTEENARHWSNVDQLSAKFANSKEVRYRLRLRSRYECANNCYAAGIVDSLCTDCIGTGPRLQMETGDDERDEQIENAWIQWTKAVRLPMKLSTMRRCVAVDGESFCMLVSNPRLQAPVELDLRLIEADQISHPFLNPIDPHKVDGIEYDDWGNPTVYKVLKRHPGDFYQIGLVADDVDARRMIHWYRQDRPGELRGVPELTPALPLFAQLRRFTLAVIAAAETAADFAAVLESGLPPAVDQWSPTAAPASEPAAPGGGLRPFDQMPIERRLMTALPAGWKMAQFRPEQPASTYADFKKEIIKEIARCMCVPYCIAAGDSSDLNYSSGRLDHQGYHKKTWADRLTIEIQILDRIFAAWLDEMSLATDLIAGGPDRLEGWPHEWRWDGFGHVDPEKEANAQAMRLKTQMTTYAFEYAKDGKDWKKEFRQKAREYEFAAKLGLPLVMDPAPQVIQVPPEDPEEAREPYPEEEYPDPEE